tara:strand:- start:247 stop:489 length:243 start_codon:yes stop_codon:yes gene_type:complete
MITGRVYANGYWDGLDAILLKEDSNNSGWVYVLALEKPDPDISMIHAVVGKTFCCHAQTVAAEPTIEGIKSLQSFVYVAN